MLSPQVAICYSFFINQIARPLLDSNSRHTNIMESSSSSSSTEEDEKRDYGPNPYDTLNEDEIMKAYCILLWCGAVKDVIELALIFSPYTSGVDLTPYMEDRRQKRYIDVTIRPSLPSTATVREKRLAIVRAIDESLRQQPSPVNVIGARLHCDDGLPQWRSYVPWHEGAFIRLSVCDSEPPKRPKPDRSHRYADYH